MRERERAYECPHNEESQFPGKRARMDAAEIRTHEGQSGSDVREIYRVQGVNRNGSSCDRRAMNAERWAIQMDDTAVAIQRMGGNLRGSHLRRSCRSTTELSFPFRR
jgi:hypothetical protein